MADSKEQCVCFKCCFQLGENATKTFEMLEVAFRREDTQVFGRFSKFKSDVTSVEDIECLGCPPMIKTNGTVDQVKELCL